MASVYQSIEGWFDFDDIYDLALRRCSARKPARFVEVGAFKGRSTCYMAERLAETGLDVRFDVVGQRPTGPPASRSANCVRWAKSRRR